MTCFSTLYVLFIFLFPLLSRCGGWGGLLYICIAMLWPDLPSPWKKQQSGVLIFYMHGIFAVMDICMISFPYFS